MQERATVTVDAILTAVEQVLDRDGLDGLTTNRVAEVAGVSIGSLYQYYPNKEALVGALEERYLTQTFAACRALLDAAEGVPLPLVCDRVAEGLVATRERQRPIHRWLAEIRGTEGFQGRYRAVVDEFAVDVATFLTARTDVCFDDPGAAAWVIVHALEGIVGAVALRGREIDVAPIAAAACEMVRLYVSAHTRSA
jgi:AcrR family transcriptional regulator